MARGLTRIVPDWRAKTKLTLRSLSATALATGIAFCMAPSAVQAQSFGTAMFSAYVSSTGSIFRSNGVSGVTKPGTGNYQVNFTRPLSACFFSVSGVGTGPTFGNGTISTGNPNLLFVRTYNGSGTAVNVPFNVIVICGP